MTYLVHINPTPGKDNRTVEVEGVYISVNEGTLIIAKEHTDHRMPQEVACFAKGVWNYVEPKK